MAKQVTCPVCDMQWEGVERCPCDGWELGEKWVLTPDPEAYERAYRERLERAREGMAQFKAGALGLGEEGLQNLRERLRALGLEPGPALADWARQWWRAFTIGVVVEREGDICRDVYLGTVLDGILQLAVRNDYQVKLIRTRPDDPNQAIRHIEDGSVEGVILVALPAEGSIVNHMVHSRVPVVIAGSIPPDSELSCVDVDDISATYQAVQWLISLGHRRIGIMTGDLKQWSARRREQGYQMALRDAGIEPNSAWRFEGNYWTTSGEEGARQLLRTNPRPTAIVCGNDFMAFGAMRVLQEVGIRIPEEVSIIGFDDVEAAKFTTPPLTTIRQPMFEIGVQAVEVLLQLIKTGKRSETKLLLPAELVVRGTVAPPPPD